jgi:hypothetical protein
MSTPLIDKYIQAFFQTLAMVSVSAFIAIVLGLVLAVVLTVTAPRNLYPRPHFHRALSLGCTGRFNPRCSRSVSLRTPCGPARAGRSSTWQHQR